MKETPLTRAILIKLNAMDGVYAYKHHGGPMMLAGLPDIHVCVGGRCLFLEVKLPGNKPTVIQEERMAQLRSAGAAVAVVHSVDEAVEAVGALNGRSLHVPSGWLRFEEVVSGPGV